MWKVKKPAVTASKAFSTCISRIRNADLKARMEAISGTVEESANIYVTAAAQAHLHEMVTSTHVDNLVTAKEMTQLYNVRMVKSAGREVYDALIAAAEHGRCPFCGHRVVSTLDHVLPKAHYPVFAVTPDNLVPACADCNKTKSDGILVNEADQYLHPYFDLIESNLWLKAEILETTPASMRFFVDCSSEWNVIIQQRVKNHFERLKLAKLYASQAAQEFINIRYQIKILHKRAGTEGVRQFLIETHASRSNARINSWQTAFYAALHQSSWYCNRGFSLE